MEISVKGEKKNDGTLSKKKHRNFEWNFKNDKNKQYFIC